LPTVLPGVKQVHAVDAAGVHPLLLALGSERYVPYRPTERPAELLTQAHAILGQGQLSLAKYLWILDQACAPDLDLHDTEEFFQVLLTRVDWRRDLHFQTETTIDTLDYSGTGFNVGSKVIVAATGQPLRELGRELPSEISWPHPFGEPRVCRPGILVLSGPSLTPATSDVQHLLADRLSSCRELERFPLIAVVDDSEFASRTWNNFLWNVFTRSNPATDICGIGAQTAHKHWGCTGSLIIDARSKPHHAPPLIEDPETTRRVDALAAAGGPLAKYL
jgi:4-hydroxy-3-polyprenylbenzoate decarboxylase